MSSSVLPLNSTYINVPNFTHTTQPISQRAFKTRTNQTKGFRVVACNATPNDNKRLILPEPQKLVLPNVDRRNLLMGLSGLYTAANLSSLPEAVADPIRTPDDFRSECKGEVTSGLKNKDGKYARSRACCPPNLEGGIPADYKLPTESTVRLRWPAHKGTPEQVQKYRLAIQAMRSLPDDDPRSFINQAKIHCAYCHGAYHQPDKTKDIQIHNSWLFYPFHRWYLYFYERILGCLIMDPTFALPYWNWDDPDGMQIPEMFIPETIYCNPNPLQVEVHREASHLPSEKEPKIVDLTWSPVNRAEQGLPYEKQKACNLETVYRDMVRNGHDTPSFFGGKYVVGSDEISIRDKSVGSVESGSHTAVHLWVGDSKQPNNEDMGRFYSAGYDPLFYCHHANVDRMWKLWKDLDLPKHVDPTDPDWLNASYVFYDEKKNPVRVYNRDSVSLKPLGYNYIEEYPIQDLPWRYSRPTQRDKSEQDDSKKDNALPMMNSPMILNRTLKVRVRRNATKNLNETLLISGIKFDSSKFVKFDVFVNDKLKNGVEPTTSDPEYAGGFAQIPHGDANKMSMSSGARFGLKELLEDTNTENEEYVTVKLVPKAGCEDLTIGNISIINPEP
ncbi:hypothetical protein M8C21_024892 [Ambrosia artemisiifolia]|uniref:Tyrosinase copper-binding domain-containing protein n=1 Tax=Ambrosia artemisiifolia TaxID=4212 RepID=A0AAD5CM03_AMBAR|nr:hypothetical protein M8C21_024892 [Ambrosia artemisiifolia]